MGVVDGQGNFKICVRLLSKEPESEPGRRSKYDEGNTPRTHKEGSVHTSFTCFLQLYLNFKAIFGELGLDGLEFLITSDIKIVFSPTSTETN